MLSPLMAGAVGGYNRHCIGEEVEWRPPLLYANPSSHRISTTTDNDGPDTVMCGSLLAHSMESVHGVHIVRDTPLHIA